MSGVHEFPADEIVEFSSSLCIPNATASTGICIIYIYPYNIHIPVDAVALGIQSDTVTCD